MRGQYVSGWYLILNKSAAQRWIKKTFGWKDEPRPRRYPCLASAPICADESLRTEYLYMADVDNMRDALLKAVESAPYRQITRQVRK